MKDDVVSLSGINEFDVTEDYDISSFDVSELNIISSFFKNKFDTTEKLRKRFKKVSGVMMDTSVNSHGFSISPKGLKSIETHFNATKDSKVLHRKFINHKFQEIEYQIGKLTKIWYDDKTKELMYQGVDDKKHPVTDRIDSFNSVSATIAHGDRSCSVCGKAFKDKYTPVCDCQNAHPVSNRAMNIELSYVSFPAYDGTSVNVDAFSSDVQDEIKIFLGENDLAGFNIADTAYINSEIFTLFTLSGIDSKNTLNFDLEKGDIYFEKPEQKKHWLMKEFATTVATDADLDPPEVTEVIAPIVDDAVSKQTIKELVELTQQVKELRDALKA
jgi:hypothetical protein